jgi:uncharacterized membrane protein
MSGSASRLAWLDKRVWPFAWILLIPIVTGMGQSGFLADLVHQDKCTLLEDWPDLIYECPRQDALPTLLPGLLNLVAFSWVLSGRREVRWAALVAGTLGAARLAAPLLIYTVSGAHVRISGVEGFWWGEEISVTVSLGLWGLSLVSALVFLVFVVTAEIVESKERKQAATANQAPAPDERAPLLTRLRDEGLITDEEFESKRPDLPSGP